MARGSARVIFWIVQSIDEIDEISISTFWVLHVVDDNLSMRANKALVNAQLLAHHLSKVLVDGYMQSLSTTSAPWLRCRFAACTHLSGPSPQKHTACVVRARIQRNEQTMVCGGESG